MKITYIEVEADAEELKTTRNVSETLIDVLTRVSNKIGYSEVYEEVSKEDEADTL